MINQQNKATYSDSGVSNNGIRGRFNLVPCGIYPAIRKTSLFILVFFLTSIGMELFSQEWTLVWSDEFDYEGLPDPDKWSNDVQGNSWAWGNNESQNYTTAEGTAENGPNAWVEDGKLIIEARKEEYTYIENSTEYTRDYTSARLRTIDKGDWLYGRIEVRAMLPEGTGVWPAIWMLPTDWEYGGWPASGEIDIMEYVGYDPETVHFTVHTEAFNHMIGTQVGNSTVLDDPENTFYTYVIEWYPDRIDFFVDDDKHFTFENEDDYTYAEWPFDKRFHLLINIAVGGDWGGAQGIDDEIFPQRMEVEYVRVYKSPETTTISGPGEVVKYAAGLEYSVIDMDEWDYEWIVPEDAEILEGGNDNQVKINWGCEPAELKCVMSGEGFSDTIATEIKTLDPQLRGALFFEENQEDMVYYVDSMHSTTYTWNVPDEVIIKEGEGTHSIVVEWGTVGGRVEVIIDNDCLEQVTLGLDVVKYGQYPYPDINQPHIIPGTINATQYDYGGQGVAYYDTTPENQGDGPRQDEYVDTQYNDNGNANVGWIEEDEWLEYTIQVESPGDYTVEARVASDAGARGPLYLLVNDDIRAELEVPRTGAWDEFVTLSENIEFFEEDSILRVEVGSGGFNLGDMTFTEGAFIETNLSESNFNNADASVYPNPFENTISIKASQPIIAAEIYNMSGQMVYNKQFTYISELQILNTSELQKGVYLIQIRLKDDILINKRILK